MASSVKRRIEGNLTRVKGQCDPVGLIRPRSTVPIKACGSDAAQTGRTHDRKRPSLAARKKTLARRGPSTHDPAIHAAGFSCKLQAHVWRHRVDARIKSGMTQFELQRLFADGSIA